MTKAVLAHSGVRLEEFLVRSGDHPIYEGGSQMIFRFPNGWGASISFVPNGTQGIELQPFQFAGDWWELVGCPFTRVDSVSVYELLINIYSVKEGGAYVC